MSNATSRSIPWREPVWLAVLLTSVLHAQTADRAADAFVASLRRAVAAHDIAGLARLVQFPLRIDAGLPVPIRDPQALKEYYDAFFTPELQYAIRCAPVQRSRTGVTIAKQLFAEKKDGEFRITRMVGAPYKPERTPPRKPRRVIFPAPPYRLARHAGTLGPDAADSYAIWVRKGEVLRTTLTGFKGRLASLRLLNERGQPIDARAADVPRTWAGPVPDTGDYRIEVVRRAAYCEPPVVYDLAITLR